MKRTVTACALAVAALAASAQQQTGTQPARNRIEIDLRSTAATGTVPFDVPFEVTGNVPDRVERIELIYRECSGATCPKPGTIRRDANCAPVFDDRAAWKPAEALIWQRDPLTSVKAGETLRWSLPIDALEAQRRYVFLFDVHGSPSDDQAAAFRASARDAVSRRLAAVTSSDQSQQAYVDLRNELLAEARQLAPCVVVDNVLSPATDVDERFTTAIAELIDEQQQKALAVDDFNNAAVRLRTNLTTIAESPLTLLVRRMRALSATRPEVAADLDAHVDVIKFISQSPVQMETVARGGATQSMSQDVTAADASSRMTNLSSTRDLLRTLADWLRRLDRDKVFDDLLATGDLTAENAAALRALTVRNNPIDLAAADAFRMTGLARTIVDRSNERDAGINRLADAAREEIRTARLIGSDTIGTFDTFANWYMSADAGFAYAQEAETTVPYVGVNIYFRPINKDATLRMRGGLARRFAVTLALTVSSVADQKAGRQDLFNTQSLLVGGGFRVTDALRFGGGALVFERLNTSAAAATSSSIEAAPYVSISFDWNIAKQFAGLGKLFQ